MRSHLFSNTRRASAEATHISQPIHEKSNAILHSPQIVYRVVLEQMNQFFTLPVPRIFCTPLDFSFSLLSFFFVNLSCVCDADAYKITNIVRGLRIRLWYSPYTLCTMLVLDAHSMRLYRMNKCFNLRSFIGQMAKLYWLLLEHNLVLWKIVCNLTCSCVLDITLCANDTYTAASAHWYSFFLFVTFRLPICFRQKACDYFIWPACHQWFRAVSMCSTITMRGDAVN